MHLVIFWEWSRLWLTKRFSVKALICECRNPFAEILDQWKSHATFQVPVLGHSRTKIVLNHGNTSYYYCSCIRYVSGSNITEASSVFVVLLASHVLLLLYSRRSSHRVLRIYGTAGDPLVCRSLSPQRTVQRATSQRLIFQFCTVFHSARYPIILTRNAYQTQDGARSLFRSSPLHTITRQKLHKVEHAIQRIQDREHNREARSCTSCITSTYSGSLFRKRNCVTTWEEENEQFLWTGRKRFGLTNSSTAY